MKHIKKFELNEENVFNIPLDYGWGWIVDVDDRGIVEPNLVITKKNNIDDAKKIIMSIMPGKNIVKIRAWDNIVHNCVIEK